MNEKKSPFGDLCHQYRGKLHLSEQTMGQRIEAMGCKLGTKPGGNRQPVVSQFEREIDPEDASRKQHRDPPLAYVETCARLFGLSSAEKYSLFVAALQSSEKVVIDRTAIGSGIRDRTLNIFASLVLSCAGIDKIIEENKNRHEYDTGPGEPQRRLLKAWAAFSDASLRFIEEVTQYPLEYKSPSS